MTSAYRCYHCQHVVSEGEFHSHAEPPQATLDLRDSLRASIEQHDAKRRTAEEIVLRTAQQSHDLAPIQSHFGQSFVEIMAESQRILNASWRRAMFRAERRVFRQRFIRRYRR